MEAMAKVAVIIAAAGKAERFGGEENKTFAKLDGRPLFIRAIEHFVNRDDICQVILAVAPDVGWGRPSSPCCRSR